MKLKEFETFERFSRLLPARGEGANLLYLVFGFKDSSGCLVVFCCALIIGLMSLTLFKLVTRVEKKNDLFGTL